ncbi:MAG: RAMP superfamily CRISPR-associated protein [Anaerolineae bacterium]|nr:RAMP superfamily CRISPR-associated protein [Anaerolineae bacterium]
MDLVLIVRRPVQVASGALDVRRTGQGEEIVALQSTVAKRRANGNVERVPVLPGSSLKGALRSLVEAFSPSCVAVSSGATRFAIPRPLSRCAQVERLCPACRLFGMSGAGHDNYLGQVSIEDAHPVPNQGGLALVRIPLLWAPARGQGGLPQRYLKGRNAIGRKVYFPSKPATGPDVRVAFKTGSVLRTRLHFENLSEGDLGLLVSALGLHPDHRFLPKLGAGKPVGLGSVEVVVEAVFVAGDVAQTGRLGGSGVRVSGAELERRLREWCQRAGTERLLVADALQAVAAVLRPENLDRPPVEGAY